MAQVFTQPDHPYTQGLLGAMPRLRGAGRRLTVIPGHPPAPGEIAGGCAFAPRCDRVQADCRDASPALLASGAGRKVACLHPVDLPATAAPAALQWAFAS